MQSQIFYKIKYLFLGLDDAGDFIWYTHNRGKLFHDIRHQYDKKEEE